MQESFLIELTKTHFGAVKEKNIEKIINYYSKTEDLLVFVEGPRWQTLGIEKVAKGWRDFVETEIYVKHCSWIEFLQTKKTENMGFVAGIVEMDLEIGGKELKIKFRGTFIFEKGKDKIWRVIHEHFSQPAADPYGIGDWLKV